MRLEEMRVEYAKQSEALHRWVEESIDMLTELVQASSISEAEVRARARAGARARVGARVICHQPEPEPEP